MIVLTLPFPPSANRYYRKGWHWQNTQAGQRKVERMMISEKGRKFRTDVLAVAMQAGLFGRRLAGRLSVTVELFPPTRQARDIGNYDKALMDAITHAQVWMDDSQIDDQRFIRRDPVKGGRAVVRIEEIECQT